MKRFGTVRRLGVYAGIAVAALASLATNDPEWEVHGMSSRLKDTIDLAHPQASHHFTVETSQSHTARAAGEFAWDVNPTAIVHVKIQKDSDSVPQEEDVLSADADTVGDGLKANTTLSLGVHQECTASPCTQGYTVTFTLTQATQIEQVEIDWDLYVDISGSGDQPKSAYVKVSED